MAISPFQEPGFAPTPAASPEATPDIQLTEFTLAHHPQLRQLALEHPNPLCRLFAETREGARHCERGCGMAAGCGATHTCPFGMTMRRMDEAIPAGQSRWIGRRFATIEALHRGLDRLIESGISEEQILAELPANPVVSEIELVEEISSRNGAQIIALATPTKSEIRNSKQEKRISAAGDSAAGDAPVANILEYISQVQALLAAADQPGGVCERFLKAAAGVLPFGETAILLRRRVKTCLKSPARLGEELVLTAVESLARRGDAKRGRKAGGSAKTALSSHELGPIVLAEGRAMMETGGHIEPLGPALPVSGVVALPIGADGKVMGVWMGLVSGEARAAVAEPLRLIRIFSEMLGQRLQSVPGMAAGRGEALGVAMWDEQAALAAAAPEVARAARLERPVAMLDARIESGRRGLTLNIERLSIKLRASLRPYDAVAVGDTAGLAWHFLLPHVGEESLHGLSARVQSIFEDELDATGGLEERGIKLGLGVSLFGADAADAAQLVAHAAEAAAQALTIADPSAIQFHFGFDPQADVL